MNSIREKAGRLWREFSIRLGTRRETAPIASVAALQEFVGSRSAYIAQKTLYGYVKTRMGTRYPRMFEDDVLMGSLNIAKLHVFAACLSDLTIYAVACAMQDRPLADDARQDMARRCYQAALQANAGEPSGRFSVASSIEEFQRRLETTNWSGARQPDNFTNSPRELFRWAPIADPLKRFDAEIIENSIKFAWRDVREQFRNRIDGNAVVADWLRQTTGEPAD